MELFPNKTLKKAYENFVSDTIFTIFKCKYCNLESCKYHFRFDCSCANCRVIKCHECHKFNIELDIIMQSARNETKLYIMNFIRDFFSVSDITLEYFYGFKDKTDIRVEDIHEITWDLRKKHGMQKGKIIESLSKMMSFIYTINKRKYTYKL